MRSNKNIIFVSKNIMFLQKCMYVPVIKPRFKKGLLEIFSIKNNFVLRVYRLELNIIKLVIEFVEPAPSLSLGKSKRLKTFIKNTF